MRNGIFVGGLLVGVAVGGAIVFATQPLPDDVAARPAHSTAGSVPATRQAPADAVADRLQRWAATSLARPLFNPDRRPVAVAGSGSNAAAGLPRLSGIMITEAGRRAIFAATGADKPQVVAEGGTVGGNLVQSITLEEVVLVGPDGPHRLHLAFDRQLPSAAMAPPIVPGQEATAGTTAQGTTP
jgi:general secretion pathway protein N